MSGKSARRLGGRRRSRLPSFLLALAVTVAAGERVAEAQEGYGVVLRIRAEREIAAGNCAGAIPLLRQARDLAPQDARTALLAGRCAVERARYREAVESLERAKQIDPKLTEADPLLVVALYHLGELDRARAALTAAQATPPPRADMYLYEGLLLMQDDRNLQAASAFEKARSLDAEAVDPAASYYAALAWQRAEDPEKAEAGFRSIVEEGEGTAWADQAQRALDSLPDGSASTEPQFWGSMTMGFEFDDNVVLLGTQVGVPSGFGDEGDVGGVWSLSGGAHLLRTPKWSAGLLGYYTGSNYADLTEFNENFPSVLGWVDRRLDDSTVLRLQPDFGFVWLGRDPFLMTYGTTVLLYRDLGSLGSASLLWRYARFDFRYDIPVFPPGPSIDPAITSDQRNRDGNEFSVGLDYSRPLDEFTSLSAGYRYRHFETEGIEYDHQAHEFLVGVRRELPWRFVLDLGAAYEYRPYRNPSTFPDPPGSQPPEYSSSPRKEHTWRVDAVLERPVHKFVTASLRYSYLNNDSNVAVFNYDRNLVGLYLTAAF